MMASRERERPELPRCSGRSRSRLAAHTGAIMYEPELQPALEAARLAGQAIGEAYARFQAIPDAHASISTEADRQSQEIILRSLQVRFPTDALCAEEKTPTLAAAPRTGSRLWIVDPIDGTRGFA